MKPLYTFIIVVAIFFLGMATKQDMIQFLSKPLLMSTLLVYFLTTTKNTRSILKYGVAGALVFSVAGDTLLLFANTNELFFVLGLAAFLIAHLFYIFTLHKIRTLHHITGKWYVAIIVAVYYFLIIHFLQPFLGGLKYPVIIYGFVISFMLLIALHLYDLHDNLTARYLLTGAILFVVSDSILAVNKFYQPYAWGGWTIMTTYVLAQWLLVKGFSRFINQSAAS